MSGSLEINIDTRDLTRLQAALARLDPDDLDKILRATVNEVAIVNVDRLISNKIASELGVLPHTLESRMRSTRSDTNAHSIRSAWLWYGKFRLSGTRLARSLGTVFTPGQVQVGRLIFRRGFYGEEGSIIEGRLMQRLTDERLPIRETQAETKAVVQWAIDSVTPAIPALLEAVLDRRITAYIEKL